MFSNYINLQFSGLLTLAFSFVSIASLASEELSPLIDENELISDTIQPLIHLEFEAIKDSLIARYFVELKPYKILIAYSNSEQYFLRSGIRKKHLLKSRLSREYQIVVSAKYLNRLPSPDAIEAALAHELFHVVDYVEMNAFEYLRFASKYFLKSRTFVVCYEHSKDFNTLELGLENGMYSYRVWQQSNMTRRKAERKLRNYFTPAELSEGTWKNYSAGCDP